MPVSASPNSRKRQHPEQPKQLDESLSVSKRQKVNHPSGSHPPAAFWNNLSTIWLTRRALQELNRRNTQAASNRRRSPQIRLRRPITRRAVAEWKRNPENWRPVRSAVRYLADCTKDRVEEIVSLSRHGGPDLSDLRGYRIPPNPLYCAMSSSRSSSRGGKRRSTSTSNPRTTNTTTTRNSRPYDRDFQQNLIDGGVYPDQYEYPDGTLPPEPDNLEEINEIMAQPRPSLSPSQFSDGEFRSFKRANAHAAKEKQVSESVIPYIEGKIGDTKCRSGGIPFTNLNHLTDGTLVPGNPDIFYGARAEQLNRQIRHELSGSIIPSTQHDIPIVPNFFLATKGPDGSAAVVRRQACYDGALGARGLHNLQQYGNEETVYDNKAYTISSTFHDGTLKMYTSHPAQPSTPGGPPEYHMTQIKAWAMTGDRDTFRQGAAAYRNLKQWAKERRDEAIRQANEKANEIQATTLSTDTPGPSVVSSFAISEEAYEDSNTTLDYQNLETPPDDRAFDPGLPTKRPSGQTERSHRQQRKRRNADDVSSARQSCESLSASIAQISTTSDTAVTNLNDSHE